MGQFADAIALLTRVPVRTDARTIELSHSVPWFPVVGAVVGTLIAVVYAAGTVLLPSFVAAALAAAFGALVTGAFHEDGLADVADAFAGGWTKQKRFEILDDPRLGTFGVLALTSSFLVRVGAIAALDAWSALALIPAAHALSRVGGIVLMRRLPLAHSTGLGAGYAVSLTRGRELAGVVIGIAICAGLIGQWSMPAVVLCAAAALGMGALARVKIGGISGDVLGATQQVAELAILLLGVAVLHGGSDALAWWRN
jgi:adenosylcobinamide-GDP ribazoletransferase